MMRVSRRRAVDDEEESIKSWDGMADADNSFEFLSYDECSACDSATPGFEALEHICNKFEHGIVTHRKHHMRRKGKGLVFSGSDAVSFLVDNGYAPKQSRGQALVIGRKLAYEFALFHHETHDFDLEDEQNLFYVFTPPGQRVINPVAEPHEFSKSLHAIADAFEEGVVAGSNMYKNRTFKNTFVGSDAVTFLVSSQMARTRQDAVRIGQLLMEKYGMFQHVARKHRFKDRSLLYRFIPQKLHVSKAAVPIEEMAQHFIEVVRPGYVFSGRSAVDTMIDAGLVVSRSEAVLLGEKFASDLKLFHCVQHKERAFFDRPDMYYEYCQGYECLKGKVSDEIELVMGIQNSYEYMNQSTIAEQTTKNAPHDIHSTDFHAYEEGLLEDLVVFGDRSEGGLSGDKSSLVGPRCFDRFGFILENHGDKCDASDVSNDCNDTIKTTEKELSSEEWRVLLDSCALAEAGEASQSRVKQFMRIGLPDSLRRRAWTVITGVDDIVQKREGDYQAFVETATRLMEDQCECVDLKGVIERDLHRTFPRHLLFCNQDDGDFEGAAKSATSSDSIPEGLVSLRRLLYAYSIYDNEVGYCQGMNFIAAMFLTFLSEEESFWLLVAVMNDEPYNMRVLFTEDMAGVHETRYVAEKLIERFLPKLHKHMKKEQVDISMFATQWIMTVFTSTFPFDLVARVWDSYIVEGWKVVYRVILSLLEYAQQDLVGLDLEDILTYLRDDLPSKVDGPSIMKSSLRIQLRHRHIRKYTNEWRSAQNGHKYFQKRLSDHSESTEFSDTSSSGIPIKYMIGLQNAGANGKHIAKKLLPGSATRSSF